MVSPTTFARLVARPVDRVHIAASTTPTLAALQSIEGFRVAPSAAAMVAPFLAAQGMSLEQLRVPLRYLEVERVDGILHRAKVAGAISVLNDMVSYTPDGREAAIAALDARALALTAKWSNAAFAVAQLVELLRPVANAAVERSKASCGIVDNALAASVPSAGSQLWRLLAKVRRYRADCHVEAWQAAGHTVESVMLLPSDSEERRLIEKRTNELNADIWSRLSEHDQLNSMAALAALDGSGTPT